MSNPLRYSHGKLGDGLMRVPQQSQHPGGPVPLASRSLRPSSEMLNTPQQGTPETEVIDKWFEDLHTYEATLEEMAAASLDQNFKEELSAIEQWFRVLSEAERTAALYSLLQESTQVQVRFFITVLQQMARSDPVGAFLSPSAHNSAIGDQLEAKMASLGIKSPSGMKPSSSPSGRFQRQSTGLLSPNSASLYSGSADVSAALAAQRSRMKNNRTSAPGTLLGESRPYSGSSLDDLQEKTAQPESRPKSSDTPMGRSPRASGPLDDSLAGGGSWASMVNTPIMAMLDEPPQSDTTAKLDAAMAQLAQLGQDTEAGRARRMGTGNGMLSGVYDQGTPSSGWNPASPSGVSASPQFNNFNVATMSPNTLVGLQSPSGGLSNPMNLQMMNAMAAMGGLNNMNSTQLLALQQQILQSQQQQQQTQLQQARMRQRGFPQSATSTPRSRSEATQSSRGLGSPTGNNGASASASNGMQGMPAEEEVADISVLNDVPAWLRHLRLHKYTPNFEGSNWREMVLMDDQALEEKGVAAMGARRKMLKTFEAVRQKYGITLPEDKRTQPATDQTAAAATDADAEE